jgi:hypothetical protein
VEKDRKFIVDTLVNGMLVLCPTKHTTPWLVLRERIAASSPFHLRKTRTLSKSTSTDFGC